MILSLFAGKYAPEVIEFDKIITHTNEWKIQPAFLSTFYSEILMKTRMITTPMRRQKATGEIIYFLLDVSFSDNSSGSNLRLYLGW